MLRRFYVGKTLYLTMHKYILLFLFLMALTACEPFDLTRRQFPICATPQADIGVTIGQLDVTFFLIDAQGDIGAVAWEPGDGKGRNRVGTRVTYVYDQPGTYIVTLTLLNQCDDRTTMTKTITVSN